MGFCGVLWALWSSMGLCGAPWGAMGLSPTSCAPQLVFAVTMDVPHEAELGDRAEVVALASRWVTLQHHTDTTRHGWHCGAVWGCDIVTWCDMV